MIHLLNLLLWLDQTYTWQQLLETKTLEGSPNTGKNGVVVELFDGSYSSSVYSMAISGNDLYLGGSTLKDQGKHNQAIYWKNGNAVILTDGKLSGQVDSLAISENNIYALGKETDINNGIIIQK